MPLRLVAALLFLLLCVAGESTAQEVTQGQRTHPTLRIMGFGDFNFFSHEFPLTETECFWVRVDTLLNAFSNAYGTSQLKLKASQVSPTDLTLDVPFRGNYVPFDDDWFTIRFDADAKVQATLTGTTAFTSFEAWDGEGNQHFGIQGVITFDVKAGATVAILVKSVQATPYELRVTKK